MQGSSIIRRQYFGSDRFNIDPEFSVFVNCPFDREFEPILDAIIFAIVCCGFFPRSAKESERVSIPRMERIRRILFSCKYSIHDFSRYRGEDDDNLARLNMPLEFGMAMALRFVEEHLEVSEGDRHDWLLLVPSGHSYKRFISDLAGYDPNEYEGTEETVIRAVMTWLLPRQETLRQKREINPSAVFELLNEFKGAKQKLDDQWREEIPWSLLLDSAMDTAEKINPEVRKLRSIS